MRMDKFTQKAAEAIENARDLASEHAHGQIEAEHLLLALLQQNDGVVPQIVQKIGARPDMLIADMETALRTKPQVHGSNAQISASRDLINMLNKAQSEATALHDEYVSTEHVLLA